MDIESSYRNTFDVLSVESITELSCDPEFRTWCALDPVAEAHVTEIFAQINRGTLRCLTLAMMACPFCEGRTIIIDPVQRTLARGGGQSLPIDRGLTEIASFELCPRCLYWRWHFFTRADHSRTSEYMYRTYGSKLQDFSADLPAGCLQDVGQWLRRRPDSWNCTEPRRLERLVADIYRANYNHADVMHVGRSGDGGVDVIMARTERERWLIQVKRRALRSSTCEGVSTIRELLGAMLLKGDRIGAVVTTADHFSYAAHAAARRANEVGFVVELVDRARLDAMIGYVLPREPWLYAIAGRYVRFVESVHAALPPTLRLDVFAELA